MTISWGDGVYNNYYEQRVGELWRKLYEIPLSEFSIDELKMVLRLRNTKKKIAVAELKRIERQVEDIEERWQLIKDVKSLDKKG